MAGEPERVPAHRDWRELEAPLLTRHVKLTDESRFVKAGEAYFSPDGSWIVFQAVPVPPEGEDASPHYSMYVAKLAHDEDGRVAGLEGEAMLLSPPGSANTCGWFHPQFPWKVMFGSTLVPPAADDRPGFQVGTRRYVWQFPEEMEIVQRSVPEIWHDLNMADEPQPEILPVTTPDFGEDAVRPVVIFEHPGYAAEGSWSSDGRFILYTHAGAPEGGGRPEGNLWIYDADFGTREPLVVARGYDGGPFFAPDDSMICYRSDRAGDNKLQLFVATLARDEATGAITGVGREVQLTDDGHVNWAPYWYPGSGTDGEGRAHGALAYTSSRAGHDNYELFALPIDRAMAGAALRRGTPGGVSPRRLTMADGFDGLGVFSPDGRHLMWTSQRRELGLPGSGSSQLWIAELAEGATAADLTGPLAARQAELLAIAEAEVDGLEVAGVVAQSESFGGEWLVTLTPGDALAWRARTYRVRADGHCERVRDGGV